MAQQVTMSASKTEFFRALGLNPSRTIDKFRYGQMCEEVTILWVQNVETTSRLILKPDYAQVQRPYRWIHLEYSVIQDMMQQIWYRAHPAVQPYYEMGYSVNHEVYNWVLKWLLWHVCRYRERKAKRNGPNEASMAAAITASSPETNVLPRHDYWATVMS